MKKVSVARRKFGYAILVNDKEVAQLKSRPDGWYAGKVGRWDCGPYASAETAATAFSDGVEMVVQAIREAA